MNYTIKDIKKLPDTINKEQFREVCHISKRTATFYLQSGLLPCHNSGKKTRCYSIKKMDLIQFLNDLQENPARYTAPDNWYKGSSYSSKAPNTSVYLVLNEQKSKRLSQYYNDKMKNCPDVMRVAMIHEVIGYAERTIKNWCRAGRIKSLLLNQHYVIPKIFLIEYLASEEYNNILRKSEKHLQTITDFKNSRYGNELLAKFISEEE